MSAGLISCVAAFCLVSQAVASSAATPEGVSPGAVDRFATTRSDCPTFSWQAVAGTDYSEIVAYRLADDVDLAAAEPIALAEAEEVLYAQVPGGATAWTPELEQALEAGGRYVWFVRALVGTENEDEIESSDWSQGRFFSVAAAPSAEEVEQALEVLQRYLAEEGLAGAAADLRDSGPGARRAEAARPPALQKHIKRSVLTAPAAINGSMPDAGGEVYGLVGVTHSPQGAGMAVANTAPGADLVLDGSAQGVANTLLSESGIDRSSTASQSFDIINSGPGDMRLKVDGVDVVTTDTDQDILGGLHCSSEEVAKWSGTAWLCADDEDTGLVLPYDDSHPTAGATFKVNNTSASGNVFAIRGHNSSTAGSGVYGWSRSRTGATSGVVGHSSSAGGTGVFGLADSSSGQAMGVVGTTLSTSGAGVAAFGAGDAADVVVGGTGPGDDFDNGVIASDPRYASSDLRLSSNHSVQIQLDTNDDEGDEGFSVVGNESEPLFEVDSDGTLRQPAETRGLLKAVARVNSCGGDTPGFNATWSVYGIPFSVEDSAHSGSCVIDFGFPFSTLNVIGWVNHDHLGVSHLTCGRYSGHEDDQIVCTVFDSDGLPISGSRGIQIMVF